MTFRSNKRLERMRQSPANWKRRDLEGLLFDFGFQLRHGGKHDVFTHPLGLRFVVPRHGKVKKVYIQKAVKLIDYLLQLQETGDPKS